MKFVEVRDEVSSSVRGEVVLRMNGDVRVVTLVGEEWRDSGRVIRSIVVGELGDGEERSPVILLIRCIDADVLFQGLVRALCLTVRFGMVTGGVVKLHL